MPSLTILILAVLGATCAYELGWERGQQDERNRLWGTLHDILSSRGPEPEDEWTDRAWEDDYL